MVNVQEASTVSDCVVKCEKAMKDIKNGGPNHIEKMMAKMTLDAIDEVMSISFNRNDNEDNVSKCVTSFVPELKQLELLIETCENLKEAVKAEFIHQFCVEFFDENTKCYNMQSFTDMLEKYHNKSAKKLEEEQKMNEFKAQLQAKFDAELKAAKEAMKTDMEL